MASWDFSCTGNIAQETKAKMNLAIYGVFGYIYENAQKHQVLKEAVRIASQSGKPLLNAGCGCYFWAAINQADVNLDVVPRNVPGFVLASIEEIPFPDKYFGAVFCSHVLEHVDDWRKADNELHRVSDNVFIITPSPLWVANWLHPDHKRYFIGNKVYEKINGKWNVSDI